MLGFKEHEPDEDGSKTEDQEAQKKAEKEEAVNFCLFCCRIHDLFVTDGEGEGTKTVEETHHDKEPEQGRA
jgi:hypothetical protein